MLALSSELSSVYDDGRYIFSVSFLILCKSCINLGFVTFRAALSVDFLASCFFARAVLSMALFTHFLHFEALEELEEFEELLALLTFLLLMFIFKVKAAFAG